jgi:AraC-like DNA-binding protein
LSRLVGISRSNLYRLFEHEGGVARYIQRERLLEARSVLLNPAATQSISAVAEDLCFTDASSFSRVFKREFGCSPSEARSAGLAPAMPRSGVLSGLGDLGHLVRPLHCHKHQGERSQRAGVTEKAWRSGSFCCFLANYQRSRSVKEARYVRLSRRL